MAVIMTYDEAKEAARVAGAKHRLARKDLRYAAQLELIEEVRGLRADVRSLRQYNAQMAALLSRWDGHGLPTARHHGEMIIPKPPRWDGSGHGEHA